MIAFMFIFNIFFCLIFSFPPIWVLCVKMMRMMMEYAVGTVGAQGAQGAAVQEVRVVLECSRDRL